MRLSDFNYNLPPELIAQHPLPDRTASRLLVLGNESHGQTALADQQFTDVVDLIQSNDLLIFNDTKVIPARLFGKKDSGGAVEVLLERVTGSDTAITQIRASKSPKPGATLLMGDSEDPFTIEVIGRHDGTQSPFFEVRFSGPCIPLLEKHGHLPLPPYITHTPDEVDQQRYQTVVAKNPGAVAAPTAGLHFDKKILDVLAQKGVRHTTLTLHVGAGTFSPVRTEDLSQHQMHSEWFSVPPQTQELIRQTQASGGRVIAVGTTSLRALESAAALGINEGETKLFITPGYQFKVVDRLITNFHLPSSTLLMLVSAFAGYENIKKAYDHAIQQQYRFFSYGDAMFLSRL
ncbi:tRNA preQ1(34) S-adenosylmethionine ribosyltransferase-isomerase QueA [Polynucleobacter sp. 30F-ANTBAC]|jgi:S-adenosylmethionine:tRNA ribosyltransferase-isomerase|uniref:tRNA preQ1(34) S-adenosylmethionine ribosyltransferase-isomerase QueA n=1 Tax=Polynucleobacter sp. 30F-ANTBAC TaxID=2689095 RepID=UPI001C0C1014|nr:tRNA preQ1(34) S-adenosylmethionine ribosyltransferase-isomerase QueA [Polynucleobacter sp. 30F-ANTBAC]MBU3600299.1 tRNA preQ1(34) S-adenosylmethionine ribosyltransferase-isomerase QueA [Polynucleobacter sp. 30F-ANTBAC]